MFELASWVASHWLEIGVAIGYVVAAARVIVKLTPTPNDDNRLAGVVAFLRHLGLHLD